MDEVWLSQHTSVRQASSERKRWTRLSGDLQLSWSHKISACLGMIYSLLHTPSLMPQKLPQCRIFSRCLWGSLNKGNLRKMKSQECVLKIVGLACLPPRQKEAVCSPVVLPARLLNWIKSVFKFLIKLAVLLVFVAWTPDWVKQWDNTANGDAAQTQEAQRWGRAETCLPTRSCDDALRHHLH